MRNLWKWSLKKWRSLTKTSRLNINNLQRLCEDLQSLRIKNLCISVPKYGILTRPIDIGGHEYGEVQVVFEQTKRSMTDVTIEMSVWIYLGRHTLKAVVVGDATYDDNCDYYDNNVMDYLFTYFANIVSSDTYLAKFGKIELPGKLSSYYTDCVWQPRVRTSYHQGTRGEPLTVEQLKTKQTVPLILRPAQKEGE